MSYFRKIECICKHCKSVFYRPPSGIGSYCSKKCFYSHKRQKITCLKCGSEFVGQKAQKRKFCSQNCANNYKRTGVNSHRWKGGICFSRGYRMLYTPWHPYKNKDGYVREHRLVMEKEIKRFLQPEEVVHHINKDKTDNRIENLKLFKNHSEHMKFHVLNK